MSTRIKVTAGGKSITRRGHEVAAAVETSDGYWVGVSVSAQGRLYVEVGRVKGPRWGVLGGNLGAIVAGELGRV